MTSIFDRFPDDNVFVPELMIGIQNIASDKAKGRSTLVINYAPDAAVDTVLL